MDNFLWGVAIFLLLNALVCLYCALRGPTAFDRILAINIVGTKTVVVLLILSAVLGQTMLLDIALVYGLLNFVLTIAASRFIETGQLLKDKE